MRSRARVMFSWSTTVSILPGREIQSPRLSSAILRISSAMA
jgi:hypothetical protein